jgi:DNA-binding HxlR family transcriptional regulator
MARERSYVDACASAHALDLIGERWALLVVRELLLGPKRFTDLRAGIPDVSPDVLGRRLRELELAGIVVRRRLPAPAGSRVYELTEWGAELEPVVLALGRWGSRSPTHPHHGRIGVDSMILALRGDFAPDVAAGFRARYELRLGEQVFHVVVEDGRLEVARGSAHDPEAVISTDPDTLAGLLFGGLPLADALRAGSVAIEGDAGTFPRFLELFPLSPPAPLPTA